MRWKSHVRFGGRAAETHQPKDWQGAAVRPLHRAPDRRGQALPVRDQGRLLQTDRRLFDRRSHDRAAGRHGVAQRRRASRAGGDRGALNVLNRRRWHTRAELRLAIVTWIEKTYHRRRRQAALGRWTPIEFEAVMATPASQAA